MWLHIADDFFYRNIFVLFFKSDWIFIHPINSCSTLVYVMAWCLTDTKPLPKPMMTKLHCHIFYVYVGGNRLKPDPLLESIELQVQIEVDICLLIKSSHWVDYGPVFITACFLYHKWGQRDTLNDILCYVRLDGWIQSRFQWLIYGMTSLKIYQWRLN